MAFIKLSPEPQSALSALSTGLGQGLSGGLQALAQQRLGELQQRSQAAKSVSGLEALGFSPQQAQALTGLPESALMQVVKQQLALPQQQAYAQALSNLLGGAPEELPIAPAEQQSIAAAAPGLAAQKPASPTQVALDRLFGAEPAVSPEKAQAPALKPTLTEQQATKLAELGLKKQTQAEKLRGEAFKLTKDERKEIIDKARSARQNIHDLDRLEELEKEGKLDTPGYVEFLKRSGLDIPSLLNPGSEEYNKIAQTFLRDAKTYLGARISNFELEQFLKTIPSLSMSPEGRKRVISDLKYFNRVALEYNEALKEVIKENKGVPPLDLNEKIDEKIDKKLDRIAEKFRQDLAKPVPQPQNRLVTGLQAALGSVVGAPGKLLGGLGHAIGAVAGI